VCRQRKNDFAQFVDRGRSSNLNFNLTQPILDGSHAPVSERLGQRSPLDVSGRLDPLKTVSEARGCKHSILKLKVPVGNRSGQITRQHRTKIPVRTTTTSQAEVVLRNGRLYFNFAICYGINVGPNSPRWSKAEAC
jgi:hypothetical protein